MSDTPRTEAFYLNLYDPEVPPDMIELASGKERSFSRTLERELAEATKQRDAAMERIKCLESDVKEEIRYKIEAWKQMDTLADALKGCLDQSWNGPLPDKWREVGAEALVAVKGDT